MYRINFSGLWEAQLPCYYDDDDPYVFQTLEALYRAACFEGVIRVFSTLNKYLNNQTDKLCGNMESLLMRILGRDQGTVKTK